MGKQRQSMDWVLYSTQGRTAAVVGRLKNGRERRDSGKRERENEKGTSWLVGLGCSAYSRLGMMLYAVLTNQPATNSYLCSLLSPVCRHCRLVYDEHGLGDSRNFEIVILLPSSRPISPKPAGTMRQQAPHS
jgi:hypothetical protein